MSDVCVCVCVLQVPVSALFETEDLVSGKKLKNVLYT